MIVMKVKKMGVYNIYLYELVDSGFIVFDYKIPLEEPFRKEFVKLFYNRFLTREIGAQTPQQFRQWVKSILFENLPRYKRLYRSQDIFTNPFVNTIIEKEVHSSGVGKKKNYGTYNSESLLRNDGLYGEYADGISGSYGYDYEVSADDNRHVDKSKSTTKNKSDLNENSHTTELFTDTPQSPVLKSATHSGVDGQGVPWNDGYLTNGKSTVYDHTQHIEGVVADGKTTYGGFKNNKEASGANSNKSLNVDTKAGNTRQKENTKALSNTLENASTVKSDEANEFNYGLTNETLSSVVIEWRETFINVTKEFLDKFEECFLSVY